MLIEWLYLTLQITSVVIGIILTSVIWTYAKTQTIFWFALLLLSLVIYCGSHLFFSISPSDSIAFFWIRIRFVALSILPLMFFGFIIHYTERSHWLNRISFGLLVFVPITTLVVIWFYPDWFWQSWSMTSLNILNVEIVTYTGWYIAHTLQAYILFFWFCGLLISYALQTATDNRKQMWSILGSVVCVLIIATLPTFGLTNSLLNPLPISINILYFALIWALFKQGLLKFYPIAYHEMIEHMIDAVYVFDEENCLVHLNSMAANILQPLQREDCIGKHANEIFPKATAIVEQHLNSWSATFETTVGLKGVTYTYDVRLSPIRDPLGRKQYKLVVMRDITSRKELETALQQSEMLYRLLAENNSDAITLHIPNQCYTYVNPAMEELTGYTEHELLSMPRHEVLAKIHAEDLARIQEESQRHKLADSAVNRLQYRYRRKDGNYIWVENHIVPILNDEQETEQVLMTIRDITDRKTAQEHEVSARLEKERVNLLANFIQDASHEFRTPLSVIGTRTYLLERADDPKKRHDLASKVNEQISRITLLIDKLLVMVKLENVGIISSEEIKLNQVLQSICDDMIAKNGPKPRLTYDFNAELPNIEGNLTLIETMVTELLENAYRFTPPDESIHVSVGVNEEGIWIEVKDTGVGILEEDMPYIFDIFWRSDKAHTTVGFGLGLPTAKRITQLHQGQLTVSSEPDVGSTFRCMLPILPISESIVS